eukprot:925147-Amorphochlora_amoeboformis.AAC.2
MKLASKTKENSKENKRSARKCVRGLVTGSTTSSQSTNNKTNNNQTLLLTAKQVRRVKGGALTGLSNRGAESGGGGHSPGELHGAAGDGGTDVGGSEGDKAHEGGAKGNVDDDAESNNS